MPFSPGELCCVSRACVLLGATTVVEGNPVTVWDRIPHVTNIATNMTANTPKLVTSSTGGKETSLCGTISQTGTLAIACHSGTAPGYLYLNNIYRIRWSEDCDNIWDPTTCAAVADADAGIHLDAYIRITALPIEYNISANQAIIYTYTFDIVSWVTSPEDNAEAGIVGVGGESFVHCD